MTPSEVSGLSSLLLSTAVAVDIAVTTGREAFRHYESVVDGSGSLGGATRRTVGCLSVFAADTGPVIALEGLCGGHESGTVHHCPVPDIGVVGQARAGRLRSACRPRSVAVPAGGPLLMG